MAWGYNANGEMWCTGGCNDGYIPCPVDHNQAPNEVDEQGPYFHCITCDFMTDGEEGGTICCLECGGGDREDTFAGDETAADAEVDEYEYA